MNTAALCFCFILILLPNNFVNGHRKKLWTFKDYPDIRGKPWGDCGKHIPQFGYICDPEPGGLINAEDAITLNKLLYELAVKTKCKCQRRSQCVTETGPTKEKIKVGFVVAIAFARNIALSSSHDQVHASAQKFAEGLQERWALGDCGNSALILVWEEQQYMYISNQGSKTKLYVTDSEASRMKRKVEHKIFAKDYVGALVDILHDMKNEFDGDPEMPVDVGTLALILSSTVAIIVVAIIMGCVCAFRCFGNMRAASNTDITRELEKKKSAKLDAILQSEIIFNTNTGGYFAGSDSERSMV